jgi:hypothetical protein
VLCSSVLVDEDAGPDIGQREVRHWVTCGLVEKEHILAVCNPLASQLDSEPPAQGLDEQQPVWERLGREETPHRCSAQRALLPR